MRPGLAEAGRDLVEDQQRAVPVARLAHAPPVARRRQIGHRARGLGDQGRDVALAREHVIHHAGAGRPALVEDRLAVRVHRVAVGAAIAGERRDVLRARRPAVPPGRTRNSASPDRLAAPKPAPWKASQNESVLNRPVAARASLTATSTASDPPVVNSTFESSPGAIAASFSASSTAGSQA